MQNEIKKKIVLITGASRGIGKAIAETLNASGYKVIGTSRNVETIPKEDKITGVRYLQLDLTINDSIEILIQDVGTVDVLINNAGISQVGPIEEVPMKKIRELFEPNLFGLIYLTQGLLPQMRIRKEGLIINITSMTSRSPVPFSTFYGITKAGVEAFSKGLQNEVERFGIKTVVISPFEMNTTIPQEIILKENSPYYDITMKAKKIRDKNLANAPDPRLVGKLVLKILKSKNPKFFYPVGNNGFIKNFLIKHASRNFIKKQTIKRYQ
ncbi:SDR family oxidoreductase [Promethearchaeum syntrophicum]|uniref:SDR family oxidoreductase n=2 Tax=Promethearchaeum syntrophicum TaxID=2594042 RepID=A0A5B9D848_9ARCH|nr:SDR family oxidoreductase [Candidatus Prometheoarchaeum syntrophicum]QEE15047.1 short chain dehydrogenase [Candidatus Prometheoarchaeum syntrophicum]